MLIAYHNYVNGAVSDAAEAYVKWRDMCVGFGSESVKRGQSPYFYTFIEPRNARCREVYVRPGRVP
jgi:hypothetical protein